MASVRACALLLLCDLLLWSALWAGLVLLDRSSSWGLGGLWVFGASKWMLLHRLTRSWSDEVVLHRLAALVCLLPPVFQSLRVGMAGSCRPAHEPGMAVAAQISSAAACLLWETWFPDGEGSRKEKGLDPWPLLLRLTKYFRPDFLHLVAAFTFLILGVVCDAFIPYYQGRVIDMLRDQDFQTSFSLAIGQLALVSLTSSLCNSLRGSTFLWTLVRLNRRMKQLLYASWLRQDMPYFETHKPGNLSSRLHSDVDKMGRTIALNANVLVRSVVKAVFMLMLMLQLSWELTLLTIVEMPLLALLQKKYTTFSQELKTQMQDSQAEAKELARQSIGGIKVVRSFKAEECEVKRYKDALKQMYMLRRRKGIFSTVFLLLRRVVSVGINVLTLRQGHNLISSGQITVGNLVSFFLYKGPMDVSLRGIMYVCGDMVSTVGIIARLFDDLDRKPNCREAGELAPEKLEGKITLNNVTFAYPSAPDKPVLRSVSMELSKGKMTAIVGPSGGGKTSCVSLLKRLYEPQEGQILLDGHPLHCYKHKYLHQKVAVVSQDPVLFSGSVSYNIGYGLKDCTLDWVKEAARRASADGFISALEEEYDTDVGEGGVKLAKGQRQCVAIARALVRQPQVIILDEATSSLDADIQHAVAKEVLACGKTLLVVAHQLKTVERADLIIFIENGAIVEQGTHQELMAKEGRYHRWKEERFT